MARVSARSPIPGTELRSGTGTQALERGLGILEAVGRGAGSLAQIGAATGCTRSTTQRLVSALTRLDWLGQRAGAYVLGPQFAALAGQVAGAPSLAAVARPVLERLGRQTQDTVHLGVRAGADVLYVDKIAGQRGLEMRSRVGQRMTLVLTGVGRALLLDAAESEWRSLLDEASTTRPVDADLWVARMLDYRARGRVFDLEDNERGINCVAAPVRDRDGRIVAALSVASATPYLPRERMDELGPLVIEAATDVSRLLLREGGLS